MRINTVIAVIILLLVCSSSFSQVKDSSVSTFSGFLSATGFYQSGNTNKFLVQGRGELKRVTRILETILFAAGSYGENRGNKDNNSYYGTLTADLYYQKMFSPFALQYLEYNFGKGIDLRSQSGAGIKYLFIPAAKHKSSVSLAFIYDYINLVSKPGNSESKELRLSFRFKSRQELFDKHLILYLMTMYQPAIDNFSQANLFIESNLEIPMVKSLHVVVDYFYEFDNVVSVGRKRADNRMTFGMKLVF